MDAPVRRRDLGWMVTVAKRRAAKHRPQGEDRRCGECGLVDCEPLQTALRFLERHAAPAEPIIRPPA
ncbi:hypothetical protein [Micromonospora maritima]|uniref:hypothetical protein n=1 Tax=Micromonospora maritima TaxID=986711 RepID=UPI00157CD88E|nr:hypothetical protein [Micromonospora maritima]